LIGSPEGLAATERRVTGIRGTRIETGFLLFSPPGVPGRRAGEADFGPSERIRDLDST